MWCICPPINSPHYGHKTERGNPATYPGMGIPYMKEQRVCLFRIRTNRKISCIVGEIIKNHTDTRHKAQCPQGKCNVLHPLLEFESKHTLFRGPWQKPNCFWCLDANWGSKNRNTCGMWNEIVVYLALMSFTSSDVAHIPFFVNSDSYNANDFNARLQIENKIK